MTYGYSARLAEEAEHLKVDLAISCHGTAKGDHLTGQHPSTRCRYEKDRDGRERLEHLNEGHAQSEQSAGVIGSRNSDSCSRQIGGVAQYE
jgi:hypothetical protein